MTHRTESSIIEASQDRVSDMNWRLGEIAAAWMKRLACGRSLKDFAGPTGVDPARLQECLDVFVRFGDVRSSLPHLRWVHFKLAMDWDDTHECLSWANDSKATPAEMRAWRRAGRADVDPPAIEQPEPEPQPKRPAGRLF